MNLPSLSTSLSFQNHTVFVFSWEVSPSSKPQSRPGLLVERAWSGRPRVCSFTLLALQQPEVEVGDTVWLWDPLHHSPVFKVWFPSKAGLGYGHSRCILCNWPGDGKSSLPGLAKMVPGAILAPARSSKDSLKRSSLWPFSLYLQVFSRRGDFTCPGASEETTGSCLPPASDSLLVGLKMNDLFQAPKAEGDRSEASPSFPRVPHITAPSRLAAPETSKWFDISDPLVYY